MNAVDRLRAELLQYRTLVRNLAESPSEPEPEREEDDFNPSRLADTGPKSDTAYEWNNFDPRLAFLWAPSLYSSDPNAQLMRNMRMQARIKANVTVKEVQLDFIHRVESATFRVRGPLRAVIYDLFTAIPVHHLWLAADHMKIS
jgi:hypothetical protein